MERHIATVAVVRAVLVGRLIIMIAAIVAGIRLVDDPTRPLLALLLVAAVTMGQLFLISRHPAILRRRLGAVTLEVAVTLAVLAISQGGPAYFCYAAGSAMFAGTLLGSGGLMIWLAQAGLGLAVVFQLLRATVPDARSVLAPFLVAIPIIDIVGGLGAAALTAILTRYIRLAIETTTMAQRSAAASERARLARELHDSVAKTLRGVSFAAVALPSSLRRQPDLAEQLAATVSAGAETAQREARELLGALRRDVPDQPFADTVRGICAAWSTTSGTPVALDLALIEPTLAARYELTQILHEALRNVVAHARATRVAVTLARVGELVELTIRDDGAGFAVPDDLSLLSVRGSFGVVGMSERARTAGGHLAMRSRQGSGTTIVVTAPEAILAVRRVTASR
ncbi:hypothetical protein GCM10023322_08500 [Rugosimonospora acidiphila]|uniref:Histidine kinase/HSP90-like ATPase domain-containing protein n=1 Tax=Rugosimonospora acidiphila TaxID=556531 RepID=A0ABP9RJW8_9ACTN